MAPQQAYGGGAGYTNGMNGQAVQNPFVGYPTAISGAGGSIPASTVGGGMPQQTQQAGVLTGPMLEALKQIPEDQKVCSMRCCLIILSKLTSASAFRQ